MKKDLFELTIEEFTRLLLDCEKTYSINMKTFKVDGGVNDDEVLGTYSQLHDVAMELLASNPDNYIAKDTDIIYVSWVMAGMIKVYGKAKAMYHIVAVVAVGMDVSKGVELKVRVENELPISTPFYLVFGGYRILNYQIPHNIRPQVKNVIKDSPNWGKCRLFSKVPPRKRQILGESVA